MVQLEQPLPEDAEKNRQKIVRDCFFQRKKNISSGTSSEGKQEKNRILASKQAKN